MQDHIIELVCHDLQNRSEVGYRKYGVGVDRTDLSFRDWIQHAYEETLDKANYLRRILHGLDTGEFKVENLTDR